MYAGRMGWGAAFPTALGESPVYGLAEVSAAGYGPYLGEGNFFDKLADIASKVGIVSEELSTVASGKAKIATIPTDRATITFPMAGTPIAASIPLLPLAIGAGVLLYFGLRRRR